MVLIEWSGQSRDVMAATAGTGCVVGVWNLKLIVPCRLELSREKWGNGGDGAMDCGYVVKFTYCSEAVVVPLVQSWSFIELCNAVRSRLKILNSSSFMLRYSIPPDSVSCLLENDVDMKMMFRSLTRFNSDYVEIMAAED
ncbi:hypothetical protein M0R45_026994 [Rubus argutus]|uniref:PB1 domain-containing protein n=1 Tax=Rubus argutus TaxID=59490 RepID=A0AAW1WZ92_RUBAR